MSGASPSIEMLDAAEEEQVQPGRGDDDVCLELSAGLEPIPLSVKSRSGR